MSAPVRILYCHCAYAQVVPKAVKDEVLRRLNEADVAFDAVADLCEMSAKADPALKVLASAAGGCGVGEPEQVRIAACYPRAVKWLFSAGGAPLPASGFEVLNMRTETAERVAEALLAAPAANGQAVNQQPIPAEAAT